VKHRIVSLAAFDVVGLTGMLTPATIREIPARWGRSSRASRRSAPNFIRVAGSA
jgi:hypothetical protein